MGSSLNKQLRSDNGARIWRLRNALWVTILAARLLAASQPAWAQQDSPPATPARPTLSSVARDSESTNTTGTYYLLVAEYGSAASGTYTSQVTALSEAP